MNINYMTEQDLLGSFEPELFLLSRLVSLLAAALTSYCLKGFAQTIWPSLCWMENAFTFGLGRTASPGGWGSALLPEVGFREASVVPDAFLFFAMP
jgi:hypothetical protein